MHSNKKMKELIRIIHFLKKNKVVIAVASLIVIIPLSFYGWYYSNIIVSQETWGQFGDYFGGTVNPLLSFLTIIILVNSIYLQQRQLRISVRELKLTKEALVQNRQEMKNANEIAERNISELERKHKREDFMQITKIISDDLIRRLESNYFESSNLGYTIINKLSEIKKLNDGDDIKTSLDKPMSFLCRQLNELNQTLVDFNTFENGTSLIPNHYYLQFQEYAEIIKDHPEYKDKFLWEPIDNKLKV